MVQNQVLNIVITHHTFIDCLLCDGETMKVQFNKFVFLFFQFAVVVHVGPCTCSKLWSITGLFIAIVLISGLWVSRLDKSYSNVHSDGKLQE